MNSKKVHLSFLLLLLFTMILLVPAYASQEEIKVTLDGQELQFDTNPIVENGRVLVPLRVIFEALEADVKWDEDTKTVTAVKGEQQIELKVGAIASKIGNFMSGLFNLIYANIVNLDVAPKIINDRVLVPLRFVSESLGAEVGWDSVNRTAVINSQKGIPAFTSRVIDGDTIVASLENGKEERLRFILVDTPETVRPGVEVEPFGPEATQFTKNMLEWKNVKLILDESERDIHYRLLAYVEVDGVDIGEALLREGLARIKVFANTARLDRYREVEAEARKTKKGIWSLEN